MGFNHNVMHLGWEFHVQTEDSGVQTPHIITHLFRNGGILATRKSNYDSAAAIDVVKHLMQAQHKAVLKDLRSGSHDQKIRQYLGEPPAPDDAAPPTDLTPHQTAIPGAQNVLTNLVA